MPTRSEIKFIEWWGNAAGPDGLVTRAQVADVTMPMQDFRAYSEAARREPESGRVLLWGLNPAGHDLIETAKIAGIPDRADDEPIPEPDPLRCETCGDTGERPIIGRFTIPCTDCGHMNAERRAEALGEIDEDLRRDADNPWVTARAEMLDLFADAHKSNRRVECTWNPGDDSPLSVGGIVTGYHLLDDNQPVRVESSGSYLGWWCCLDSESHSAEEQGWISAVRYESSTASSNPSPATV